MEYGIIFITNEEVSVDESYSYDYKDAIYKNEFNNEYIVVWKGQNKHRYDYIVTDKTREIHVCARKKKNEPYTYYGLIMNETLARTYTGDRTEGIPDVWTFKLRTDGLDVPFKTIFERRGDPTFQQQAVQDLGFTFTPSRTGIYRIYK
jgi:hypothetical protein